MEYSPIKRKLRKRVLEGGIVAISFLAGACTTTNYSLEGAALGSGLGAVIGNQSGEAGEGAVIGGLAGMLLGSQIQKEQIWIEGHYEYNGGCRYWIPGHYEYR